MTNQDQVRLVAKVRGVIGSLVCSIRRPKRRSMALAVIVALSINLLGGAVYAMHLLGSTSRPHVVLSCSGFGARWHLSGSGAYRTSVRQFTISGGTMVPLAVKQVAQLQRPQYWVVPANADIVDTCGGGSTSEVEIGTNLRARTQLMAISVVPLWESNQPTLVPPLRTPTGGGCSPHPTAVPVRPPDGRPIAQLRPIPKGFARSVSVTFPPCYPVKHPPRVPKGLPPASRTVGFQILSQIQYEGSAGTVVVLTARPTPAALRPGLNLGSPAGTLPDGTRVWNFSCCPGNDVRWMEHGLIVSVSGDLSLQRLKALAGDVGLK